MHIILKLTSSKHSEASRSAINVQTFCTTMEKLQAHINSKLFGRVAQLASQTDDDR